LVSRLRGPAARRTPRDVFFRGMRASSLALAFGAFLFLLPIPGTFVTGALVLLAGGAARYAGH
jgi:hypothetical protein